MTRALYSLGAISGAVGVALGAFGAHALRARLAPERMGTFQTGVQYQVWHAFATFAAAYASVRFGGPAVAAGWLFLAGTALFSGSLYGLAVSETRWLGALTPFGGLCFLAGWVLLAVSAASG